MKVVDDCVDNMQKLFRDGLEERCVACEGFTTGWSVRGLRHAEVLLFDVGEGAGELVVQVHEEHGAEGVVEGYAPAVEAVEIGNWFMLSCERDSTRMWCGRTYLSTPSFVTGRSSSFGSAYCS